MEMMDISDLPNTDLGPRLSLPPPTYTPLQPAQGELVLLCSLSPLLVELNIKIKQRTIISLHSLRVVLQGVCQCHIH